VSRLKSKHKILDEQFFGDISGTRFWHGWIALGLRKHLEYFQNNFKAHFDFKL
jgi:hypothetical protein